MVDRVNRFVRGWGGVGPVRQFHSSSREGQGPASLAVDQQAVPLPLRGSGPGLKDGPQAEAPTPKNSAATWSRRPGRGRFRGPSSRRTSESGEASVHKRINRANISRFLGPVGRLRDLDAEPPYGPDRVGRRSMVIKDGLLHRYRWDGVPCEKDWVEGRALVPRLNCDIHGSGPHSAGMLDANGAVLDRALLHELPKSGHVDVLGLHRCYGSAGDQSAAA